MAKQFTIPITFIKVLFSVFNTVECCVEYIILFMKYSHFLVTKVHRFELLTSKKAIIK